MAVHHCPECGREIYFEGICYYCRTRAERERYQAMSADELARTVREIVGGIETIQEWDKVYKDFKGLLSCRDIDTEAIAAAAFAKEIYYPPELYRNASAKVRDGLIRLLEKPDCADANNLLKCLARIGDDVVVQAVRKMDLNPLPWREKLHWSASQYLMCGDLYLDGDGKPVQLAYEQCYALLPGAAREQDGAVRVAAPREEICPQCGCKLVDILTMDGRDERLSFLGLDGKLRIPICPNCAGMCEKTVVRYTLDGDSTVELIEPFGEENYFGEKQYAELTGTSLVLAKEPSPSYFQFCPEEVFTVGGRPEWVQDPQYEDCPGCGKKMKLLAQMSWNTVMDYTEGDLFMQICTGCRVVVLVHQQT